MSIGETLASARRRAGLTIAEVSQRTRVRERLIEGIERDDFADCGGDFYARGHIRSIGRAIGIDPEPLVEEYDRYWRQPDAITEVQRLVAESRAGLPAQDEAPLAEPHATLAAAGEGPLTEPYAALPREDEAPLAERYLAPSAEDETALAEPHTTLPAQDEAPLTERYAAPPAEDETALAEPYTVLPAEGETAVAEPSTALPAEAAAALAEPYPPLPAEDEAALAEPDAALPGGYERPLTERYAPPARPAGSPWQPRSLPPRPIIPPRRPRRNWPLVLAAAAVVVLGIIGYALLSGPGSGGHVASPPSRHASPHQAAVQGSARPSRHSGSPSPTPTPARRTSPAASPARVLSATSAAAFGPGGNGGDNPDLAHLAVDGSRASAWHTDWYTSAGFGNLYPGTGLLLNMGHPVTISKVQVVLGGGTGGQFQLRAGPQPSLGSLRPVATAGSAVGVVTLRLHPAAHGKYLLIWFTRLPADQAGSFQASVHDVTVTGRP